MASLCDKNYEHLEFSKGKEPHDQTSINTYPVFREDALLWNYLITY
jgi:hypothetical protein